MKLFNSSSIDSTVSRLKSNSKALFISLFFSLLLSGLFTFNPTSRLMGDGGDNYEFFGFMYLTKQNLLNFNHPFAKTDILRYPFGFEYSYGFDGAFSILTGALLSMLVNAVLAYNLTVVLVLFLNMYVSFVCFKKIATMYEVDENKEIKAYIAAIIFGLSPYVFARINAHLNLAFVAGVPVLFYSLNRFYLSLRGRVSNDGLVSYSAPSAKDFVLFYVGLLLLALGSLQYLILSAYILIFLFTLGLVRCYKIKHLLNKSSIPAFLKSTVCFLFLFSSIFGGYIWAMLSGSLTLEDKPVYTGLLNLFVPNGYLGALYQQINFSKISIENVASLSIVENVALVLALFYSKSRKLSLLAIALYFVHLVLSLNLIRLPFYSEGTRFIVVLSLFTALVFVYSKTKIKKFTLFVLLILLLLERLTFNVKTAPFAVFDPLKLVRNYAGEAVINVPMSKFSAFRSVLPYFYNKKILDGYFHYTANNQQTESFFAHQYYSRFTCQKESTGLIDMSYENEDRIGLIHSLRADGIRTIVVLKDSSISWYYFEECDNVRDWWQWLALPSVHTLEPTSSIEKLDFELLTDKHDNRVELYSDVKGKLTLTGLFVTNSLLRDVIVHYGDTTLQKFTWNETPGGYGFTFDPPLEVNLDAGDTVVFSLVTEAVSPGYIVLYHRYEVAEGTAESIQPFVQNVYKDALMEIYQLNYN